MVLIGHETVEAAKESANELRGMGAAALRLMQECVEEQGVTRKKVSDAAKALEGAGFVYIRDIGFVGAPEFLITPSLTGEEALELLDEMKQGSTHHKKSPKP